MRVLKEYRRVRFGSTGLPLAPLLTISPLTVSFC
jgi:hypothetical protein